MPNIDITELLSDPDFATEFDVVRRAAHVGDDGRQAVRETRYEGVVGVVAPASYKVLRSNPDLKQASGVVECWTNFLLQGAVEGATTDVILWGGNRYSVEQVTDWAGWGAGWRHAVAILQRPIPRGDDT